MKKILALMFVILAAFVFVACDEIDTPPVEDTTPPVIAGTSDFTHVIGDSVPNWLEGVTATDDVDGTVEVIVDATNVIVDVAGTYDLVYTAIDEAGNEQTVTVTVTVVEPDEVPIDEHNIIFGEDPFDGTSIHSVGGVGLALYYDAKEDDVQVESSQVEFTVQAPSGVVFAPEIKVVPRIGGWYLRAFDVGEYVVTLKVTDANGDVAVAPQTLTVNVVSGDVSNPAEVKAQVRAIYPNNISANPDYRLSEGTDNEYLVVGKNFTVFDRTGTSGTGSNFAAFFVGPADFDGGTALLDYTISFKYTALNSYWKLLMSAWTGEWSPINDAWSGDILRLLTNRDQIGIQGDTGQSSAFQDEGEATDIPLRTEPVYIKFTRTVEGTTVTFNLYTSLDGVNYVHHTTAVINDATAGPGGQAGYLTGFLFFSIDHDFIVEDLNVSPTVFTLD